jgi:WD40 repeat protein
MKHIILLILLTLGVWAQEVGVPYVKPDKHLSGAAGDYYSFVLNGNGILFFDGNKNIHLLDLVNGNMDRCTTDKSLQDNYEMFDMPYSFATMNAFGNIMYLSLSDKLELWDMVHWQKIKEVRMPHNFIGETEVMAKLQISQDGKTMISAGEERNIYLWDLKDMTIHSILRGSDISSSPNAKYETLQGFSYFEGHHRDISSTTPLIKNKYLFSASSGEELLRKWDTQNSKEMKQISVKEFLQQIWVSHDENYILPYQYDVNLTLYDTKNLTPIRYFSGHNEKILNIAVSPNEKYLYGFSPKDKTLIEWDMKTGKLLRRIMMQDYLGDFLISKNEKYIVSEKSGIITFWHLKTFKEVLKVYIIGDCGWVIITQDGYFNSSENSFSTIRIKSESGEEKVLTSEEVKKYQQPQKIQTILNDILTNTTMEK